MEDQIILAAEVEGIATEDLREEVIGIPSTQVAEEEIMDIDLTIKLRRRENSVVRDKEVTETIEEAVNLIEEEERAEMEERVKDVFQKTRKRLRRSLTKN